MLNHQPPYIDHLHATYKLLPYMPGGTLPSPPQYQQYQQPPRVLHMEVSQNMGTPSLVIIRFSGMFPNKNHPAIGYPRGCPRNLGGPSRPPADRGQHHSPLLAQSLRGVDQGGATHAGGSQDHLAIVLETHRCHQGAVSDLYVVSIEFYRHIVHIT